MSNSDLSQSNFSIEDQDLDIWASFRIEIENFDPGYVSSGFDGKPVTFDVGKMYIRIGDTEIELDEEMSNKVYEAVKIRLNRRMEDRAEMMVHESMKDVLISQRDPRYRLLDRRGVA